MVREAQKMMADPNFQTQMKQMMEQNNFQQALEQTKESMADPEKLKEMEAKAAAALSEGNAALEEYEAARRKRITEQVALAKQKQAEEEAAAATDDSTAGKTETDGVDDGVEMPVFNLN